MKLIFSFLLLLIGLFGVSQELFVYTESASNMAKGNLMLRCMTSVMKESKGDAYNNHLMPELMYGINSKWMVNLAAFISNRSTELVTEGGMAYIKYKFFNNDDVQKHFRMAAFTRYSNNNASIHQEEINLIGHNTGAEFGLVATQLLHKLAISSGLSFIQAFDNDKNEFPKQQANSALYGTLSFGQLIFPLKYTSYKQTNLNVMCEFIGEKLLSNDKYFIDAAPSIQFIFNSTMRLDFAYRFQLSSNMVRTASNGFLIRFEYNFYNLF